MINIKRTIHHTLSMSLSTSYPKASDYVQYDPVTHVYERADTYIGADVSIQRDELLYDMDLGKMVYKTIDIIPGVERLFLEILLNASDNVLRSYKQGINPDKIHVDIGQKTIAIKNYGLPIPVEKNNTGVYVAELIFGRLLTGSNFGDTNTEAGKNGLGAKATNIYSTRFAVYIHDHIRKLSYSQIWEKNMSVINPAVIKAYKGNFSTTEIVYDMDFERFGLKTPTSNTDKDAGYPEDLIALFYRHAIDISFISKIPVIINETKYNFLDIKSYASLYFDETEIKTGISNKFFSDDEKLSFGTGKYANYIPTIEYLILDTPDEGKHISFVNGISTKEGGVHVQALMKVIGEKLLPTVNETITKKLVKLNKGKELDAKTKRANTVSLSNIKEHVSVLLSVRLLNPKFSSQSKLSLEHPTPKITLADNFVKVTSNWKLIIRLYATIEAKQQTKLLKTDGKLKKHVSLDNAMDANFAGGEHRKNCVAICSEGKSAKAYVMKYISLCPGGKDYYGVFPLKGKSLNVMGKDDMKIGANAEYKELKVMLGLKEGMDYSNEAAFNTLRYGKLIIMADADDDGSHIVGLLINFFYCRYPTLLEREYIQYYKSPIIRVNKGATIEKFYTIKDYDTWKDNQPNYEDWTHKYYKGLGTSKNEDVEIDYKDNNLVTLIYDEDAKDNINLAFRKDLADKRKEWIGKCNTHDTKGYFGETTETISNFINNGLILYSIANIERSIPKITDGFKESHRKIIFAAHKKFKPSETKTYKDYPENKVARFSMYVAEKSIYQHGEKALADVIITMAQDFTGSNNIAWFTKDGQFGTRYYGGTDAANPRYPNTRPETLFSFIIRREDTPILDFLKDEGEMIEPSTYYPIIPMALVNGANGIATGYSTMIPCHNPLDIIQWLKAKLKDSDVFPKVYPWYKNYKGEIKVYDRRKATKKSKKEVEGDDDAEETKGCR
jgi:DNA topoisomerase II